MKILYLRTLFAFNLKAGGSVGHTSGVIHALDKVTELKVVSNDHLAGVKRRIDLITPWIMNRSIPNLFKEFLYSLQLILTLCNTVKNYDAIYQRHSTASFVGAYLADKSKIPFILEFNSSEVWKLKNWKTEEKSNAIHLMKNFYTVFIRKPLITYVENFNLKYASIIIVVSDALKETLLRRGIAPEKIMVNPNGVDTEKFKVDEKQKMVREKYNLHDRVVVGFLGTFGQWHGVMEMVQAIDIFFEQNKPLQNKVTFLLVGDGVLYSKAYQFIQQSQYRNYVIFTGLVPQEQAVEYLAACDIFLSPHIPNADGSKFFGSPTKLFEYMAMGKGIVASDLDQIGEILEHGKTAYLVEPGNVGQLAEGIKILVENENLRQSLGNQARGEVVKKYTWDQHVKRLMDRLKVIVHKEKVV